MTNIRKLIEVHRFIKHTNLNYAKIIVKYRHDSLIAPDGTYCFGMFDTETEKIYVAGKLPLRYVFINIAHECFHLEQKRLGKDYDEKEAEEFAEYWVDTYLKYHPIKGFESEES